MSTNFDWTSEERPKIPVEHTACSRCGTSLVLVGPRSPWFNKHDPETGRPLYGWYLRCPSRLAFFGMHDEFRLIPYRDFIGISFDRWAGPQPVYAEIAS